MASDDFTISYHTWEEYLGVMEELTYETEDIRFRFSSYSYETDPMDVVSDILCLDLSIEKKVKDAYIPLGNSISLAKWENHMHLSSLAQPLSWENKCKKAVHVLIESYEDFNKDTPTPPDLYYRKRLSDIAHHLKDYFR